MRKFNLKDSAAKRMKGLDSLTGSVHPDTAKPAVPAEKGVESPMPGIRVIWKTDTGLVRKNNQDAVIIGDRIFGVADGMGGHNAGEIASGGLRDGLLAETKGKYPERGLLEQAIQKVNNQLFRRQEEEVSLTGMGTTLTVMWVADQEMIIAQIGDSRAYRIREGQLKRITEDHSMVADMVRSGVLTEEQAATHPMRNYITRAVGTDDELEVDLYCEKREPGDRWLVCSDGLYGLMSKSELERLASINDPEEAAEKLMQTALANGGRDNISLVLLLDDAGAQGSDQTADLSSDGEGAES